MDYYHWAWCVLQCCAQHIPLYAVVSVISAFSLSLPFKSLAIFMFQLKFHLFCDTFIPAMSCRWLLSTLKLQYHLSVSHWDCFELLSFLKENYHVYNNCTIWGFSTLTEKFSYPFCIYCCWYNVFFSNVSLFLWWSATYLLYNQTLISRLLSVFICFVF